MTTLLLVFKVQEIDVVSVIQNPYHGFVDSDIASSEDEDWVILDPCLESELREAEVSEIVFVKEDVFVV